VIFPDIPNNLRVRGEVTVPIYTAGRVAALVSAAQGELRASQATARVTDADVVLDASAAYWNLAMARARVVVLERGVARADAHVADVRARVDAGVLPPNDLLSAQAQRARQNVQLIQTRNAAAIAEMRLGRAVGLSGGEPIALSSPLDRPASNVGALTSMSLERLVARAHESRPERQALLARHEALEAAADAARRALRPQVSAFAAIEPARPNARFVPRVDEWNTAWDLGLNVTWSMFDGGRSRAQRASSLAQATAVTHRLKDLDAGITVDVRQQLLEIESTRAALEASNEAVDAAAEARRVIGERFTVGVAISTELLDADVVLLDAELERSSLLAALRLIEARIVRAVGGD
jgi:outer membrane protein TolC